jgi:1,4-alpha-glucan branching enzyme
VHPVRAALVASDDEERDIEAVAEALLVDAADAFRRVIYTESHDEVANGRSRVPEEIWPGYADSWPSRKRAALGAALVLTAPGIPMLFQGQELIEGSWFTDEEPLDWSKRHRHAGLLQLHRDLIRLRRNGEDTTRGLRGPRISVHHRSQDAKVIAFHRWELGGPRDDVVVVANLSASPYPAYRIGVPRAGLWRVRFNSDWAGYDPEFEGLASHDQDADADPLDGFPFSITVGIGPYASVILSQDD